MAASDGNSGGNVAKELIAGLGAAAVAPVILAWLYMVFYLGHFGVPRTLIGWRLEWYAVHTLDVVLIAVANLVVGTALFGLDTKFKEWLNGEPTGKRYWVPLMFAAGVGLVGVGVRAWPVAAWSGRCYLIGVAVGLFALATILRVLLQWRGPLQVPPWMLRLWPAGVASAILWAAWEGGMRTYSLLVVVSLLHGAFLFLTHTGSDEPKWGQVLFAALGLTTGWLALRLLRHWPTWKGLAFDWSAVFLVGAVSLWRWTTQQSTDRSKWWYALPSIATFLAIMFSINGWAAVQASRDMFIPGSALSRVTVQFENGVDLKGLCPSISAPVEEEALPQSEAVPFLTRLLFHGGGMYYFVSPGQAALARQPCVYAVPERLVRVLKFDPAFDIPPYPGLREWITSGATPSP